MRCDRGTARLFCFLLSVLSLLAVPAAGQTGTLQGRVVRVVDGDTVDVQVGTQRVVVRLEGVDCPEGSQPWSSAARDSTARQTLDKTVTLRVKETDRYGRTVARVFVAGSDVSKQLLREGLAWHFKRYNKDPDLAQLEIEARSAGRGLWSDANPVPPWQWRSQSEAVNPPTPSSGGYHGNVKSHKFHSAGCKNFNCKNCQAVFATRQDALAAGYVPARCCNP